MLRHLFFAIIAASNGEEFINLIEELLKDGGKWILASAGTTGVEPPSDACVHVTITDTGGYSKCILVNHNITPHRVKIIEFHGTNENNVIEIISRGPIHQYMIKGYLDGEVHEALRNEVDWDAAINSPLCYYREYQNINNFRYIIAPIDKTTEHILLIGVRIRMPAPEYQVAILTKTKIKPERLDKMTEDVNIRNYLSLKNKCMLDYAEQLIFPTNVTLPPYCLPSMHKRCAEGMHWQNNSEYGVLKVPPNLKELETILVKHLP